MSIPEISDYLKKHGYKRCYSWPVIWKILKNNGGDNLDITRWYCSVVYYDPDIDITFFTCTFGPDLMILSNNNVRAIMELEVPHEGSINRGLINDELKQLICYAKQIAETSTAFINQEFYEVRLPSDSQVFIAVVFNNLRDETYKAYIVTLNDELLRCTNYVKCALHNYGGAFNCEHQLLNKHVKELHENSFIKILAKLLNINEDNLLPIKDFITSLFIRHSYRFLHPS